MAITLYAIVYMGTGSCILLSWSHNNVFFSVSACVYLCVCVCVCVSVCVHVVVSLVITICVSLTVWSGTAPRPAAYSALCWNPGSTVCLTLQWGQSRPDASPSSET